MCEDCSERQASFGLEEERKKRWCSICAKSSHPGSFNVRGARDRGECEDCSGKSPTFGLADEGTARWCAKCAKAHDGAAPASTPKCEDCKDAPGVCARPPPQHCTLRPPTAD